jgi:hypothetical protein
MCASLCLRYACCLIAQSTSGIGASLGLQAKDVQITYVTGDSALSVGFKIKVDATFCNEVGQKLCSDAHRFVSYFLFAGGYEAKVVRELRRQGLQVSVTK